MATKTINSRIIQYNSASSIIDSKVIPNKMLANTTAESDLKMGDGSTKFQSLSNISGVTPIGTIIEWNGVTVPTGYLNCNGAAISRTTYSSLYAAIGTNYGAGNGSTTFNLPNTVDVTTHGVGSTIGNLNDRNTSQAHNHGAGDIHTIGGAWGGYTDSYGFYESYGGNSGTAMYGLMMRYFMDNPKNPSDINHATLVAGSSTSAGNPPPFIKRKLIIKY